VKPIEGSDSLQEIEKLRERHKLLEVQKITAEANLKNSQDTLGRLKQQARESFGTDDVEQLRKKLEAMKLENEEKRICYQQHLDEIERQLAEVERQHAEAARKESQA
jgi:hypothetical protein